MQCFKTINRKKYAKMSVTSKLNLSRFVYSSSDIYKENSSIVDGVSFKRKTYLNKIFNVSIIYCILHSLKYDYEYPKPSAIEV